MMNLRCKYSSKLKIAVTGSTGFIGRQLLKTFNTEDFVDVFSDAIPPGALLIHLAAEVSPSRDAMLRNLESDSWLIEQVNRNHRGLIYASTNNVYPYSLACRTSEHRRCNDYYAASKIFAEMLISDTIRVPSTILRIADVFGIGQRHGNFFRAVENSLSNSTPLKLYGKGLKCRNFIHVNELCRILHFICTDTTHRESYGTTLNVGYGDSANIFEIVEIVSKISGLPIECVNNDADTSHLDIRTMDTVPLPGYQPLWPNFREALVAYVNEVLHPHLKTI